MHGVFRIARDWQFHDHGVWFFHRHGQKEGFFRRRGLWRGAACQLRACFNAFCISLNLILNLNIILRCAVTFRYAFVTRRYVFVTFRYLRYMALHFRYAALHSPLRLRY